MITKIGALIILLSIPETSTWFLCPPSNGCRPMPPVAPPCCNQQIPLANNCNGCSSNNNYPQAQSYQTPSYLQPQQYPQQMYQTPQLPQAPQIFKQQYQQPQQPQQQQQYQTPNQYPSQQGYGVPPPSDNKYPQAQAYITPNPCYQIGKYRCCNQKLQFEMENFLDDYQNSGASMCNYNRLAKEMQYRLESNFNVTFETLVSLGDFETKSYYEGYQVCRFEKRGKHYMAYETPFENPADMIPALEKDLGHPVGGGRYNQNAGGFGGQGGVDHGRTGAGDGGQGFEFGTSSPMSGGKFQITDVGTSSHTLQKSKFTKSRL
uniref:Ground-like domain-containing protein n=1 Tax=Strongyloides papillosus TaxID=174720 RepID=A0A0N5BK82_STREA